MDILFYNAPSAVRWAEEWMTRPEIETLHGRLMRTPGGGELSVADIKDIAATISLITSQCKPYRGELMQLTYGHIDPFRVVELAKMLAQTLVVLPAGSRKEIGKLERLCIGAIKRHREKQLFARIYPKRAVAQDIGINPTTFIKSPEWRKLLTNVMVTINLMESMASTQIETELEKRGWLS